MITVRRQRLRLLAASLVATLATGTLAACGGSDSSEGSGSGADSGFPVTLTNTFGKTTIAEKPERIVTLGWNAQDIVYALGETPVAIPEMTYGAVDPGIVPWDTDLYDPAKTQIFKAGANFEIPLEKIASYDPDVILAPYEGFDKDVYDKLSAIAPTVGYPGKAWQTSWQDQTTIIGTALGKSAEADALVDGVSKQIAEVAAEHPEFKGKSIAVASLGADNYVYLPTDPRVQILGEMGFVNAPGIEKLAAEDTTGDFSVIVSKEKLVDTLDADVLIVYADGISAKQFDADKVYAKIPAVAKGAAYVSADTQIIGAMSAVSVLSVPWVLDKIVPSLAQAADAAEGP